jgi:hypothetical protein
MTDLSSRKGLPADVTFSSPWNGEASQPQVGYLWFAAARLLSEVPCPRLRSYSPPQNEASEGQKPLSLKRETILS